MTSPIPDAGAADRPTASSRDHTVDPRASCRIELGALQRIAAMKYGDPPSGWGPAMRRRFGYYTPDDVYESVVERLITPGCRWLDVGCGRDLFPTNRPLAKALSDRCGTLVGVDPDPAILENSFVHSRIQSSLENVEMREAFEVITMRMAVEHVQRPAAFVKSLRQLCVPGGLVVVYTANKWAPVSVLARLIPFAFHHYITSLLWGREEGDSFPVEYRMNTRGELAELMRGSDFVELHFEYLDDCRTLARFRVTSQAELLLWKCLNAIGLHYPETCLLAVYQRAED